MSAGGIGCLAGLLLFACLAPSARAGDWMQVSCVNPNGSIAPSEGWTNIATGSPEPGSNASTGCGPGVPMEAYLGAEAPAPVAIVDIGSSEDLQYTPPSGSTLTGGTLDADLYGDSYGPNPSPSPTGQTGSGDAILFTPAFVFGGDNAFFQCAWEDPTPCSSGPDPAAFSGTITIPAGRGGDLYIAAACGGNPQTGVCDQNPSENAWTYAHVISADLLLFNGSSPAASEFGGGVLAPNTFGTSDLTFTATDPGGPGIYNVTAKVDGTTIYNATPDTQSGRCVPVGTDTASGALMFDYQQPCPTTESVVVPVDTSALTNGEHLLVVTVTDAAQNTATVLDQTITTLQPVTGTVSTPPARRHHVRAKLVIVWRYTGAQTRLLEIKARHLPRHAHVAVRCHGPGCPRPQARTAAAARVRHLWAALTQQVFTAGEHETFTITAPGLLPERLELRIRNGAGPVWKRL